MDGTPSPQKQPSARHRRAVSAVARLRSAQAARPSTARMRPYSAYTRRGSEDEDTPNYVAQQTNREWWRYYVKETPVPGTYRVGGFLDELQKRPSTYSFRDSSRAKSASHQRFEKTGETLLPGAYESSGFVQSLEAKHVTYGFKSVEREQGPKIGHGCLDKELNTSPMWYSVVDYSGGVKDKDTKTGVFKSRIKRTLSAPQFRIVKGPGPGQYDSVAIRKPPEVSSSFKSQVPRFNSKKTKVPGPGTYSWNDSVFGQPKPLPAAVQHLQKKHGIAVS